MGIMIWVITEMMTRNDRLAYSNAESIIADKGQHIAFPIPDPARVIPAGCPGVLPHKSGVVNLL